MHCLRRTSLDSVPDNQLRNYSCVQKPDYFQFGLLDQCSPSELSRWTWTSDIICYSNFSSQRSRQSEYPRKQNTPQSQCLPVILTDVFYRSGGRRREHSEQGGGEKRGKSKNLKSKKDERRREGELRPSNFSKVSQKHQCYPFQSSVQNLFWFVYHKFGMSWTFRIGSRERTVWRRLF